jgi:F-type H+-transporting ATPase subunit delta
MARLKRQLPKAARVYAKTLFEYAGAHGGASALRDEFVAALDAITRTPGLERALNLAALAEDKRAQLLRPLAAQGSETLQRLLKLLELKGRLALLPAVLEHFLLLEEEARRVRRAVVTSASALDAGQLETLARGLAARNPGYTYLLDNEIDPSLIAGFRVEEDGLVTDTSLRHKLDEARRTLVTVPLAPAA